MREGRRAPGARRRASPRKKKRCLFFFPRTAGTSGCVGRARKTFDRLGPAVCVRGCSTHTLSLSLRCTRLHWRCWGGLAGARRWKCWLPAPHLAAVAAAETAAAPPPLLHACPGPGSGFNKEEAGKNNLLSPPSPPPPPP